MDLIIINGFRLESGANGEITIMNSQFIIDYSQINSTSSMNYVINNSIVYDSSDSNIILINNEFVFETMKTTTAPTGYPTGYPSNQPSVAPKIAATTTIGTIIPGSGSSESDGLTLNETLIVIAAIFCVTCLLSVLIVAGCIRSSKEAKNNSKNTETNTTTTNTTMASSESQTHFENMASKSPISEVELGDGENVVTGRKIVK